MNTITVYQVVVGDTVRYSCLTYEEADDYGTAYYGERDKDYRIAGYEHQPADYTKNQ